MDATPTEPSRAFRVAYLVTHPIQYQAPLLRRIAADPEIDLTAFFGSAHSTGRHLDREFGREIEWDVPLLDGYAWQTLPQLGPAPADGYGFWRPFSRGLGARLHEGRFDALWVHGYARAPHLLALAAARRLGVRTLLRDETSDIGRPRSATRVFAKRAAFAALDRLVDGWLTIGTLNERHLGGLGVPAAKMFRMPYAVDNAWFAARAEAARPGREALRARLGLEPGRPVALFAAKLIARKAPLDLVRAFARIAAAPAGPAPCLLMAGDGELRGEVERAVAAAPEGAVRLLGFQGQRDLAALYDLCDLFVLPSEFETWGLVVNEAMNAGRAVLASDRVGAAADLVREGVNGATWRFGDAAGLEQALRQLLSDPARLAAMGRASLEIVRAWGFDENVAGLKRALRAGSAGGGR